MKKQAWTIIKVTLSFLTFAVLISCSKSINEKPNIIIVMTDDQGYGDLSCFGSETIQTPNVDRLAEEGMRFTDAHAPGRPARQYANTASGTAKQYLKP